MTDQVSLRDLLRAIHSRLRRAKQELSFLAIALTVVFGSLFGIVVVQTLIVQNRVELDDVDDRLEVAREENQRLRLQVLELEAPDRVLSVAIGRLAMIRPDERRYLPGIDPAVVPVALPEGDNPFGPGPLPDEAVDPATGESGGEGEG